MSRHPGQGRRPRRSAVPVDPAMALHRYAVKLFDREDGRAVDWPMVAAMLFKAGLAAWDEAGRSERAMQVLRRLEAHVYDRTAGNNPEDGTAFTTDMPERASARPSPELAYQLDAPR